jgi:hypothetical protein
MNYLMTLLMILILASCGDRNVSGDVTAKDGKDGSNCSVEQLENGAKISCQDGSVAYIYNGKDGLNGSAGQDGSSCTITANKEGAEIECTDGSSASLLNGSNGSNGQDGKSCQLKDLDNGVLIICGDEKAVVYDGEDANSKVIGIESYIFPCGKEFNNDEIFLRLTDGNILALYDGGPNEDRLVLLAPGNYITTDRNKAKTCHFTVDADLNLINETVK